jgi:excinuclease UvrABC ATPase subunit
MQVDRYKIHDIEVVIDRIKVDKKDVQRLRESVAKALKEGKGLLFIENLENGKVATYSKTLMCTTTGISYEEPSPNTFSFNSPYGACPYCKGLGVVKEPDLLKIIPDKTKILSTVLLCRWANTKTITRLNSSSKFLQHTNKISIIRLKKFLKKRWILFCLAAKKKWM